MEEETKDRIILAVARLVWREGVSMGEFFEALGVPLDDLGRPDPFPAISHIAGILEGWSTSPSEDA